MVKFPILCVWDSPGRSENLRKRQIQKLVYHFSFHFIPFGLPSGSEVKASARNAGDLDSIPGSGSSPGEGYGNPLQNSCLENPKNRGAWSATVHGIAKSWTRLSDLQKSLNQNKGLQSYKGGFDELSQNSYEQVSSFFFSSFCLNQYILGTVLV